MHARTSSRTLASLQCRDGARRVFTDHTDITTTEAIRSCVGIIDDHRRGDKS